MSNIKALSLLVWTLWPRLKFLSLQPTMMRELGLLSHYGYICSKFDQNTLNSLISILFTRLHVSTCLVNLIFDPWPQKSIVLSLSLWLICVPSFMTTRAMVYSLSCSQGQGVTNGRTHGLMKRTTAELLYSQGTWCAVQGITIFFYQIGLKIVWKTKHCLSHDNFLHSAQSQI